MSSTLMREINGLASIACIKDDRPGAETAEQLLDHSTNGCNGALMDLILAGNLRTSCHFDIAATTNC